MYSGSVEVVSEESRSAEIRLRWVGRLGVEAMITDDDIYKER